MVKEYVYVQTIENNYSNWISIYEGSIEKNGKVNFSSLPVYFNATKCIFRKECNASSLTEEVNKIINYSMYDKENMTIIYNEGLIHESKVIAEEEVNKIIETYNKFNNNLCENEVIIKSIENLNSIKNVGEYTIEFLKINDNINSEILGLTLKEKEQYSNLLLEKYDLFVNERLEEAKKTNKPILIYFNITTEEMGERGYKYEKEYIYPDGRHEKKEGYTNE